MKRYLSLLSIMVIIVLIFTGCGAVQKMAASQVKQKAEMAYSSETKADIAVMDKAGEASQAGENGASTEASKPAEALKEKGSDAKAITTSEISSQTIDNKILAQRKIIRNANISVEVEDFEKSYGKIKSMTSGFGFIQETSIKKEKVYVNDKESLRTSGVIIVRVDKDKFESILSDIKGLGLLLDENIKSDDVTDKFFDTESRLRLLRFEEGRLEEYIKKQNDPDIIFKTESRLTDIRHEIEKLTGTLRKWTDLVELSTITINMAEKNYAFSNYPKKLGYFERLGKSFTSSIGGVVNFCGEMLIFVVSAFPVIILLGIFGVPLVIFYRRFNKNRVNSTMKLDKDKETEI